jgi:hypothetical protein
MASCINSNYIFFVYSIIDRFQITDIYHKLLEQSSFYRNAAKTSFAQ